VRICKARRCLVIAALDIQTAANAAVVYGVTVDTSSVSGTSGFLEMQFNPGGSSLAATATVSGFNAGSGVLIPAPDVLGNVTGTLPRRLVFHQQHCLE